MEMHPESSEPILPRDIYLTEESMVIAALVDQMDINVFERWRSEENRTNPNSNPSL